MKGTNNSPALFGGAASCSDGCSTCGCAAAAFFVAGGVACVAGVPAALEAALCRTAADLTVSLALRTAGVAAADDAGGGVDDFAEGSPLRLPGACALARLASSGRSQNKAPANNKTNTATPVHRMRRILCSGARRLQPAQESTLDLPLRFEFARCPDCRARGHRLALAAQQQRSATHAAH